MFQNQKAFSFFEGYRFAFLIFLNILFVFSATACTQKNRYSINLMPAPDVYAENIVDPFLRLDRQMQAPFYGILYATDRMPADKGDTSYLNKRGFLLRLGIAKTELGSGEYTWEEARRISLLKNRTDKYPLKVTEVEEIGILDRSFTVFTPSV